MASNTHTTSTSRRAILAAAMMLPAVTMPTVARAIASTAPSASDWDRAMKAYLHAKAKSDAFDATWAAADRAYEAAKPDPMKVELSDWPYKERFTLLHTVDIGEVERVLSRQRNQSPANAARISAQLADFEKVRLYRRQRQAADVATGYSVTTDRCKALCDAMCAAESRLMAMPAPHAEALAWKLEKLLAEEGGDSTPSWNASYVAQTIADFRRLLTGEG